jgi:putative transposase
MVNEKVNQLLNAMLDGEAEEIASADRYELCGVRKAYRNGHYERELKITT